MSTIYETKLENNDLVITGGSVTQQETRQIKQYNPNSYTTSYTFQLPKPVSISDLTEISKINRQVNTLHASASIVNRKSQARDGLMPCISSELVEAIKSGGNLAFPDVNTIPPGQESAYVVKELNDIAGKTKKKPKAKQEDLEPLDEVV